ncbi:MAG: NAD(P)/FAD-dependent oxidoreductase [Anaeromyxobacter sp.]|nr:NAD(P)/FAD-dependent oxidoreductase [Anaeromyxobacter sp.]MBL0277078.1 NAD(P)/FAD-dependent oxidoreductase [Anaeromyxobacter sp.]
MSGRRRDVVVAGGGPAGLAFAAASAGRGLDVLVLEARPYPVDKACGEGLLPAGVRALEALGVRARLGPADASPLRALRWVDAAGPEVTVPLPAPGGLGVRRTALSAALLERAREAGAEVLEAEVLHHRRGADEVLVQATAGEVRARLLVAADGLASPVRRREGLDLAPPGPRRSGLRRHLALAAWTDAVEVHLGAGVEAYLTPAGAGRLGVAFLFEGSAPGGWAALLGRFPALAARLEGAAPASEDRGAGPFLRAARTRTLDRLVLLGDAAGYLDALTGEGLSLALGCALDLAALAPDALAAGAGRDSLAPYERAWRRRFTPYARSTRALLAITRRPALRRALIALCARAPAPLTRLVAAAVG